MESRSSVFPHTFQLSTTPVLFITDLLSVYSSSSSTGECFLSSSTFLPSSSYAPHPHQLPPLSPLKWRAASPPFLALFVFVHPFVELGTDITFLKTKPSHKIKINHFNPSLIFNSSECVSLWTKSNFNTLNFLCSSVVVTVTCEKENLRI